MRRAARTSREESPTPFNSASLTATQHPTPAFARITHALSDKQARQEARNWLAWMCAVDRWALCRSSAASHVPREKHRPTV